MGWAWAGLWPEMPETPEPEEGQGMSPALSVRCACPASPPHTPLCPGLSFLGSTGLWGLLAARSSSSCGRGLFLGFGWFHALYFTLVFLAAVLDQREPEERLEINFCTLQTCKTVNETCWGYGSWKAASWGRGRCAGISSEAPERTPQCRPQFVFPSFSWETS